MKAQVMALEAFARQIDNTAGQLDGHAYAARNHPPLLIPADEIMALRSALNEITRLRNEAERRSADKL